MGLLSCFFPKPPAPRSAHYIMPAPRPKILLTENLCVRFDDIAAASMRPANSLREESLEIVLRCGEVISITAEARHLFGKISGNLFLYGNK
jgi:hypothetical protein